MDNEVPPEKDGLYAAVIKSRKYSDGVDNVPIFLD